MKDIFDNKRTNLNEYLNVFNYTDNQKGIMSSKYLPGPLSQMERGLEKFKNWYLNRLSLALS